MQSPNRNKIILISIVLLPVIISVAIFIFVSNRNSNSNSEEYFDPGSGETVSSPKNKTPELFGTYTSGPLLLGFSKLINAGLTTDQLKLVEAAAVTFSGTDGRKITELSVTVDTIEQNISEGVINLTFELTANRQTKYLCLVSYSDLDSVQVVITDKAGKQVFDSGVRQISDLYIE